MGISRGQTKVKGQGQKYPWALGHPCSDGSSDMRYGDLWPRTMKLRSLLLILSITFEGEMETRFLTPSHENCYNFFKNGNFWPIFSAKCVWKIGLPRKELSFDVSITYGNSNSLLKLFQVWLDALYFLTHSSPSQSTSHTVIWHNLGTNFTLAPISDPIETGVILFSSMRGTI